MSRCMYSDLRWRSGNNQSVGSSVPVVIAGGCDLEIGYFLKVASIVVTWWIVAFCAVIGQVNM